jgi:UDP-N-acetylmuramate dehydrogenase
MEIKKNVELSGFTTFGIGGPAEYFCVVKSKNELIKALEYAKNNNIPWHILGGGSNVLIPDKGVRGLVIKNASNHFEYGESFLVAESGISLAFLVADTIKNGRGGLEFASGIPGTVGGAIFGNAGAYGESIGNSLICATVYIDGRLETWHKSDFDFSYRYSKLKSNNNIVVIDATIKLNRKLDEECYSRILDDKKRRADSYFGRNVGSYFKNVSLDRVSLEKLNIPNNFVMGDKIVAAKLIESLGLKGFRVGGVVVSEKHANVINNVAGGTSADVKKLEKEIINKVYNKYHIILETEVIKY